MDKTGQNSEDRVADTPRASEDSHPDLFATAGKMLADLDDDTSAVETALADTFTGEEDSAEHVEEESVESSTSDDVSEETHTVTDEDDLGEDAGAADDSPTLPAALRRSLRAYEWSEDEIDEAFGRDPEGFLVTASKIHSTRIQQTQEWAARGRQQLEEQDTLAGAGSATDAVAADAASIPDGGIQIDFAALAESSGFDEEALRKAFGPVTTVVDAMNAILPALNEGIQATQENKDAILAREVDQFFQQDDMSPYTEFYGDSWETADNEQVGHRNKVLEEADYLIVGAGQHGQTLSTVEALEIAHHHVAAGEKEKAVRKEITSQVKQRRKGITLKPTSKTKAAQTGPPSREQQLANAAERLRKAFG
jgi:molybdopterin converting factor small subunit